MSASVALFLLQEVIDELTGLRDLYANEADADCVEGHWRPNEAMRNQQALDEAITKAEKIKRGLLAMQAAPDASTPS